jgi:hypothetical protein
MGDLGEPLSQIRVATKAHRLPKLGVTIDLNLSKIFIGAPLMTLSPSHRVEILGPYKRHADGTGK